MDFSEWQTVILSSSHKISIRLWMDENFESDSEKDLAIYEILRGGLQIEVYGENWQYRQN